VAAVIEIMAAMPFFICSSLQADYKWASQDSPIGASSRNYVGI
jgi:hypothetical protein